MIRININDIVGETFSKLLVIGYSHHQPHTNKSVKHFYKCQCSCGKETIVERFRLMSGDTKSCGCANSGRPNLVGKRFGRLTVVEKLNKKVGKSSAARYLCLCDCGNYKDVSANPLSMGLTKSCGCWNVDFHTEKFTGETNPRWKGGSPTEYPPKWTRSLRERIRNRDDRKCQYPECDYDDTKMGRKLDVHHIDGDKCNCEDYNLISLCSRHHAIVECNDPSLWEDRFYMITRSYQ